MNPPEQPLLYCGTYFSERNKISTINAEFTIPNFLKIYEKIKELSSGNFENVAVEKSFSLPICRQFLLMKLSWNSEVGTTERNNALCFVLHLKTTLRTTTIDVNVTLINQWEKEVYIPNGAFTEKEIHNSEYLSMPFSIDAHLLENAENLNRLDTLVLNFKIKEEEEFLPSVVGGVGRYLEDDAALADVTIVVKGTTFKKHKCVLAARSPVFASMFTGDFVEKRENRVEINDIDSDTFADLLAILYAGEVPVKLAKPDTLTFDLLMAADKYEIGWLKEDCESYLSSFLQVDTVAETLDIADMLSADILKKECLHYIFQNNEQVYATEGWTKLTKKKPKLIIEVIETTMKEQADREAEAVKEQNDQLKSTMGDDGEPSGQERLRREPRATTGLELWEKIVIGTVIIFCCAALSLLFYLLYLAFTNQIKGNPNGYMC